MLASIATFGIILGMALEGYKSNNNVMYSSKYHVVWRPKYRRSALLGSIAKAAKLAFYRIHCGKSFAH